MKPERQEPFCCGWVALQAGIDEADRRARGDFDGLLGDLDPKASRLLRDILGHLRDYLLDRYTDDEARRLLARFEPRPGYRNMPVVGADVLLALDLLNAFRSAARCTDDDAERPEWFTELFLGKVGVRDKAHSRAQGKRGSAPRYVELTDIVEALAKRDATAKELWPELRDKLDAGGHNPVEHEGTELRACCIEYTDDKGEKRNVTFGAFQNRLARVRKSQKPG